MHTLHHISHTVWQQHHHKVTHIGHHQLSKQEMLQVSTHTILAPRDICLCHPHSLGAVLLCPQHRSSTSIMSFFPVDLYLVQATMNHQLLLHLLTSRVEH